MARYYIHRPPTVLALVVAVAGAFLALLPGGCASPRYLRPEIAAPPSYRGDAVAPGIPVAVVRL
jgi:hypothetical protein